jgi:UDP-GlcNAc:undecaprenyl-phosphate/decaprenyl-phosphate GlcNAc-1-phosphate transferase
MGTLIVAGLLAAALAAIVTPMVARLAVAAGIVDRPGGRRIHPRITPRIGGLAVAGAFFAVLVLYLPQISSHFRPEQPPAFMLAALFLIVVGVIDDRRGLGAGWQLAAHIIVALVLVAVGMGIEEVTSPFGGKISLHQIEIGVPFFGAERDIQLPADLLTVAWVVLVINAVNWLDGLDGLASGVGLISSVTLVALSLTALVNQPHVALLGAILAGSLAGFLPYNFHPARIFLGTAGSTFIGFTVATLAIISGGKVATALLVLGFPIIDALTIIVRRTATGALPWQADTRHLHHLLLARGFSIRRAVVLLYLLSASFGGIALLAGTTGNKLLAMGLLALLMGTLLVWLARTPRRAGSHALK